MPEVVEELARDLKMWRKTSNARMALLNPEYDLSSDFRNKQK